MGYVGSSGFTGNEDGDECPGQLSICTNEVCDASSSDNESEDSYDSSLSLSSDDDEINESTISSDESIDESIGREPVDIQNLVVSGIKKTKQKWRTDNVP